MPQPRPFSEVTVGEFLADLAARTPAPGGGACAALHAAQAAALLAMVARYSDGARYAPHSETIGRVRDEADRLRARGADLAEADARAFAAVAEAYRLPKAEEDERARRSTAIATALAGAVVPPIDTLTVSHRLVELAGELLPVGNRNVLTDVAAAAEAARAAATTARVNVEVNLAGITDPAVAADCRAALAGVDDLLAAADTVTATVRAEIAA